jgi:2-phospho-L-lactate guanylyltransferase
LVVSRSPAVLASARRLGAAALRERGPGGLNEAIEVGCAAVGRQDGEGVLVLPADLPELTVQDLAALAQLLMAGADVVAAPSRDGGTNALGLRLPPAIAPAFGTDSFARHVAQAQAVACRMACYTSPTVAFDLDWPADLGRASGEWRVAP